MWCSHGPDQILHYLVPFLVAGLLNLFQSDFGLLVSILLCLLVATLLLLQLAQG